MRPLRALAAALLLPLGLGADSARAAHVVFDLADFTTGPVSNRLARLTPRSTPMVVSNRLITVDALGFRTDTNGQYTASNVVAGSYVLTVFGTNSTAPQTSVILTIPDTNILVQAADYVTSGASTAAPGSPFVLKSSGVATNLALYTSVSLNGDTITAWPSSTSAVSSAQATNIAQYFSTNAALRASNTLHAVKLGKTNDTGYGLTLYEGAPLDGNILTLLAATNYDGGAAIELGNAQGILFQLGKDGSITFGGETRTNWPTSGSGTGAVTNLVSYARDGALGTNDYVRRLNIDYANQTAARVPVLGMNTWWPYGCTVTETSVLAIVTRMLPLKPFGYKYAVLDDYPSIRTNGLLEGHPGSFPRGLSWLSSHVRSNGLSFGIYWQDTVGTSCSATNAGGFGYPIVDANWINSIGAEYVKLEAPYNQMTDPAGFYESWLLLGTLRTNVRPVYVNMATAGMREFYPGMVNSYRVPGLSDDVGTNFLTLCSWMDYMMDFTHATQPGFFPDLCYLVGAPRYSTPAHWRSHLNLCAILPSSLIISDVGATWTYDSQYTNVMRIAILRDSAVNGATLAHSNQLVNIYSRGLGDDPGGRAVAVLNRNSYATNVTIWFTNLTGLQPDENGCTIWDVAKQTPVAWSNASYTLSVGAWDCELLKITPGFFKPIGNRYLSDLFFYGSITNGPSYGPETVRKDLAANLNPIQLAGVTYAKGISGSGNFKLERFIGGSKSFSATVGMDSQYSGQSPPHAARFYVYLDGDLAWDSGVLTSNSSTNFTVSTAGKQRMVLLTIASNSPPLWYDAYSWADPIIAWPDYEGIASLNGTGTNITVRGLGSVGDPAITIPTANTQIRLQSSFIQDSDGQLQLSSLELTNGTWETAGCVLTNDGAGRAYWGNPFMPWAPANYEEATNAAKSAVTIAPGSNVTVTTNTSDANITYEISASITGGTASMQDVTNAVASWGLTNDGSVAYADATFVPLAGGTITGALLSTASSASNAPAQNELVSAQWVRNLFAGSGATYYVGTNVATFGTNASESTLYLYQSDLTTNTSRTYSGVTNNQYLGSVVTTNTFQFVDSPVVVNGYLGFNTGGGRAATVKAEIYFSYDRTNWFGDYDSTGQTLAGGSNLHQWVVSFPPYASTNAAGFYVQRRYKVVSQSSNPNITLYLGGTTPSHISIVTPASSGGNAYLAANQTFTGSNHFSAQITAATTNGPMQLVRGDWATNIASALAATKQPASQILSNIDGLTPNAGSLLVGASLNQYSILPGSAGFLYNSGSISWSNIFLEITNVANARQQGSANLTNWADFSTNVVNAKQAGSMVLTNLAAAGITNWIGGGIITATTNNGVVTFSASSAAGPGIVTNSIYVPAGAMGPSGGSTADGGRTSASVGSWTNGVSVMDAWDFDSATNECATFQWAPGSAFAGTVSATFYYCSTNTAMDGSSNVVWGLAVTPLEINSSPGAWVYMTNVTATLTSSNTIQMASLPLMTLTNYTANALLSFRASRLGTNAADALVGDARLLGVRIGYTATNYMGGF